MADQIITQQFEQVIAPSAVKVTPNYVQVGEKYVRTLFMGTYPRFLNAGWFSPIINLDRVLDISIFVVPQDTSDVLKQLRIQLAKLEAQMMEESAAGNVRNPILETAVGDIEVLRDKLQQGTERFFKVGIYVTVYATSIKELDENEEKINGILESQLVVPKQATFRMLEGFMATSPLNDDRLQIHTSLNTEPLASTFPFISSDLTSNEGILYGINTSNNSLVLFDRFSLENANAVVFAKSGAGKSYTIKLEILRQLITGTQVIVIDPEDEYKYLSDTVGGTTIKISINSDQHLNPFDVPPPQEGETPSDVFNSHVLDVAGLIKLLMGGELSPEEDALLDQAIIQTYAVKDITPDADFSGMPPPVLSDLQNIM